MNAGADAASKIATAAERTETLVATTMKDLQTTQAGLLRDAGTVVQDLATAALQSTEQLQAALPGLGEARPRPQTRSCKATPSSVSDSMAGCTAWPNSTPKAPQRCCRSARASLLALTPDAGRAGRKKSTPRCSPSVTNTPRRPRRSPGLAAQAKIDASLLAR